jgi:RimJ/RimL family protein N-acetyltransferase
MNEISSPRLSLRTIEECDLPALFEIVQKNPELTKYLLWTIPRSLEEMKERYKKLKNDEKEGTLKRFGIFYENVIIGAISITNIVHTSGRRTINAGELGYWISPLCSGKGLVTEAAKKMLAYGFEVLKLQKIKATCVTENIASEKVLQKIGMRHVGTQKDHYFEFDRWWNMELYELTQDEFLAQ